MGQALRLPAEAVVFDSDGVLVESDTSVERAWTAWAVGLGLDPVGLLPLVHGRPARETVASLVPASGLEAALAEIDRLELEDAGMVTALPGAADLLLQLPPERWAVVTSATSTLAGARLAAAGLTRPRILVTADDIVRGKPDPEGYATALKSLGIEPAHAIVVEDTATGIAAAREAGVVTVVGIGIRALRGEPTVVVRDLRALSWHGALVVSVEGQIPSTSR